MALSDRPMGHRQSLRLHAGRTAASKVDVYVRPKIGFCNCSTGVSDDGELERVGDTELVSREFRPLGTGPSDQGRLDGRTQPTLSGAGDEGRGRAPALGRVQRRVRCGRGAGHGRAMATRGDRAPVIAFLNSRPMVLWAKKELGLEFVYREW